MTEFTYSGEELDLFQFAHHWKAYWRRLISEYIVGDVLEVGAGIGANTHLLCHDGVRRWVCLEPDATLAQRLTDSFDGVSIRERCTVVTGTLGGLLSHDPFDVILYLDVLEHIDDDKDELTHAMNFLTTGGVLIVLAPAHPWLYTPFDKAIGHRRRYTKRTLEQVIPRSLRCEKLTYLDSVGLLASALNRIVLRTANPTLTHIRFWDTFLVPCSGWLDPLMGYSIGKSILGVWRKTT